MTDGPPPPGPRAIARTLALGVVAFLATLILLFGLSSIVRRAEGGATGSVQGTPVVAVPSGPSPAGGFATPTALPSGSDDPVLVGAGDIADCSLDSGAATAALLDGIAGTVFTAGDNAYPDGSLQQFKDCYEPTWGRQFSRTRPAAGNHEWATKDLAGYLGYFGARAAPDGKSWYSYDLGTWHVIVLDSNCSFVGGCDAASEQGRWLAADLAASTTQCTLAIWHHPRFSSGEYGNDTTVAPFWRALYDAGAEVVVNGHEHDYERFKPQDPEGREDRARGIREFIVGTGGASLRPFTTSAANSELRVSVAHGVIRLVLRPTSYEWTFLPTAGDLTDRGRAACH